jgi:hypothetical protein
MTSAVAGLVGAAPDGLGDDEGGGGRWWRPGEAVEEAADFFGAVADQPVNKPGMPGQSALVTLLNATPTFLTVAVVPGLASRYRAQRRRLLSAVRAAPAQRPAAAVCDRSPLLPIMRRTGLPRRR